MSENRCSRRQLLGSALALPMLGLAPRLSRAQTARHLRIAMPAHPAQVYPIMATFTPVRRIVCNMFDTLLAIDPKAPSGFAPRLAERWERVDDRSVRFHLRRGVTFHDGSPFTAADVAFTFSEDHLLGPGRQGKTIAMEVLSTIHSVEIENDHAVRVISKATDPLLEQRLAVHPSYIASKRAFDAAGSWERWLAAPVGSGPYRLLATRTDVGVTLEANPSYWGGKAPFDRIEFIIVAETASRMTGLLTGQFDLITDLAPDHFSTITARPELDVVGGSIQNTRFVHFDIQHPSLRDVRVRRAMSLAIDRKLIIDSLWGGRVEIPPSWQLKSFGATFVETAKAPAYNPAEARRLLAAAGYAGEPIPFLTQANYYTNQSATSQTLVAMWKDVGLNVEIELRENFGQIYAKTKPAIFDTSMTASFPDHLAMIWRGFGPNSIQVERMKMWANAEYFDLGRKLGTTIPPAERKAIHARMLEILDVEDPAGLLLHTSGIFYGKRRDIRWIPGDGLETDFGPFNPGLAGT